ncbi:MAG: hydrogenase nickel incorporation protein HypB [Epsilonproteobacteria bacterium]|nr:hydrogenase accessory protein HypB [Campylobacterota bacterium]NPA57619.1 hydrogenase nickel incorporation protein HypB [Campylobacterota bacterium]
MCKDCGCTITEHHHHDETVKSNPQLNDSRTIEVITKILDKNERQAAHNREHFDNLGILAINLMSAPGSGKTSLLQELAKRGTLNFAVIEGDLETNRDAERLREHGIEAYQITTGTACHLDAFMVHDALHHLNLEGKEVCFIENVGNLVCPASYDLGAHLNIVLVSVPEGEDKIEKYPVMFRQADLILITKSDLLPYFDFDPERVKRMAKRLKPGVDILEVSTKDPTSIERVERWIRYKMEFA